MHIWGLERTQGTVSWAREGIEVNLADDEAARQHNLREAWRTATWEDWRARGLRREAHLARASQAVWQPAVGQAIRRLISGTDIGQHVVAVVTGATHSEARLEILRRREERLKARKRKRTSQDLLLAPAAGDPLLEPDRAGGSDDDARSDVEDDVRSEDEDVP
eukprot:559521-Alexandrium_andersonii.AAC.1